ncbi:hypothetical protein FPOAC1_001308 [Fusarium poae]|uniref:hypothetical protein n=1 Tax=Fusarium poae TaxID=36050 RepID=UPI001CEB2370|nr:hypothetical protein FPOAC1_001308 [Fusarium poae]KAG8675330.1 hypothetical protein FPOAC1_001308 [Fusarium poae]
MCYQISNFQCRHISRVRIPCRKFKERREACLRPLLDWLWPVKPCNETAQGRTSRGQATLHGAHRITNLNKLYRMNEPKSLAQTHFRNTALAIAKEAKTRTDMRISQVTGGRPQYVAQHSGVLRRSIEVPLCHADDGEPRVKE